MFNHLINATISFPYTTRGIQKQRQVTVETIKRQDAGLYLITGQEFDGKYKSFNLRENELENVEVIQW